MIFTLGFYFLRCLPELQLVAQLHIATQAPWVIKVLANTRLGIAAKQHEAQLDHVHLGRGTGGIAHLLYVNDRLLGAQLGGEVAHKIFVSIIQQTN